MSSDALLEVYPLENFWWKFVSYHTLEETDNDKAIQMLLDLYHKMMKKKKRKKKKKANTKKSRKGGKKTWRRYRAPKKG